MRAQNPGRDKQSNNSEIKLNNVQIFDDKYHDVSRDLCKSGKARIHSISREITTDGAKKENLLNNNFQQNSCR